MEDVKNKIIVCIGSSDWIIDYAEYNLSFDNSEEEILTRLSPAITERFSVNIKDDESGWLYKTRKAIESQNIYIIPNSTAGKKDLIIY